MKVTNTKPSFPVLKSSHLEAFELPDGVEYNEITGVYSDEGEFLLDEIGSQIAGDFKSVFLAERTQDDQNCSYENDRILYTFIPMEGYGQWQDIRFEPNGDFDITQEVTHGIEIMKRLHPKIKLKLKQGGSK